jgi:soluble lytic murein transglycosylase-like protein
MKLRHQIITGFMLLTSLVTVAASLAATSAPPPDPELREALRAAANDSASFTDRFDAEVWLTDMSRRLERHVKDPKERIRILKLVHLEASRAELPPELILAVIETESNFDHYAISVAGAIGLMQIMPFWLDEIGRPNDNLLHVDTNLRYGCTILRFYLDKEKGDLRRALARYNGSVGRRKYPNKVIDKLSKKWFQA